MKKQTLLQLILMWLGWFIVLYTFQWAVTNRLQVKQPDYAVEWSKTETLPSSNREKIYLLEPFLNRQVAWDSEYYVGIAVAGYDDPAAGRVINPVTQKQVIKNYSFFPFYAYLMKAFMLPLHLAGLNPIGAASLAGLVVALLGTLAGMVALYDLTKDLLDEESAWRSVFYLLIFPSSFFLAQVYTEGLFIGLAYWSLALSKHRQWLLASLLAALATLTRAHGALLFVPLAIAWLQQHPEWEVERQPVVTGSWLAQGLATLLPLAVFLAWRNSPLGEGWAELQSFFFGRGLLLAETSFQNWQKAYFYARYLSEEGFVYYLIEALTILVAFTGGVWMLRRNPGIALFSLAVVLLSVFSGAAQSMARYMLVAPATYPFLATLGRSRAFDRTWTILSLLIMGMSVMLYSFDMWAG